MIIDPKPYQSTHIFLYALENSPMDLSRESQTSTNTSEFEHASEEMRKSESLLKVQGRENLIFQIYVTFSSDLSNTYNDFLLANVNDSFILL